MNQSEFARGNERIAELMARPGMAEAVAELEARADEDDRVFAMSLAMIREAAKLTQIELAEKLAVTQGAISRLENRDDVLLSTLRSYLEATGASDPRIVMTVNGRQVELPLAEIERRATSKSSGRRSPKKTSRKSTVASATVG